MRRRADLIVPIRDRRQHKRYLTLNNAALTCALAFVAFLAVSMYSELRRPAPNDYGRLQERELTLPPGSRKAVEIVREAPAAVDEQSAADPMLLEPASRAQWLSDTSSTAAVVVPPPLVAGPHASDVAIVGGPEGVQIVRQERKRPVLSGGFGR